MNITPEVWKEAAKRGLDWACTGGGFDYVCRTIKKDYRTCQMTLSRTGESPTKLDQECEVGIAFHASGYLSLGIAFKNVIDALDFMQKTEGMYFLPDMYKTGEGQKADGFNWA